MYLLPLFTSYTFYKEELWMFSCLQIEVLSVDISLVRKELIQTNSLSEGRLKYKSS